MTFRNPLGRTLDFSQAYQPLGEACHGPSRSGPWPTRTSRPGDADGRPDAPPVARMILGVELSATSARARPYPAAVRRGTARKWLQRSRAPNASRAHATEPARRSACLRAVAGATWPRLPNSRQCHCRAANGPQWPAGQPERRATRQAALRLTVASIRSARPRTPALAHGCERVDVASYHICTRTARRRTASLLLGARRAAER